MIDAECFAASIAVELIAARTEHGAAPRAGVHFEKHVAAVFVVFDWKTFKQRVATEAGTGCKLHAHKDIMP